MHLYFNEIEPFAGEWLRRLYPGAKVSTRDVREVQTREVNWHRRVHLFAGVGGWEYALRLAGWPQGRPIWTGSCPCQPFSDAGQHRGIDDPRHLWPEFRRLVEECHPPTIFGEQVASKAGREWLAGVFADLEALGYAVAGADLCAASVGAPHIRQRLYWVAYAEHSRLQGHWTKRGLEASGEPEQTGWDGGRFVSCADGPRRRVEPSIFPLAHGVPARVGRLRAYGNAIVPQVAATFIRAFLEAEEG